MTLAEFLESYHFQFREFYQDISHYVAVTEVVRRKDELVMGSVKTSIELYQSDDWTTEFPTAMPNYWTWNRLIDQTKRIHLDYFVERISIQDFNPIDISSDISTIL
jgi:hypothetical protein